MHKKGPITYRNKKYGYTLMFPRWWKNHVFLNVSAGEEAETVYEFNLKYRRCYRGHSWTNIFKLCVFNMNRQQWEHLYGDSPYTYLDERDGNVFAYLTPQEPPEEFLKKDKKEYNRQIPELRWLIKMVNDDVPRIVETFRFYQ
ncbi:hypothetical protein [Caldalkalibacillus salinus]|uniref:hypothetical protein n=1 Tax=Caldalkalibacillus salinus TaxID=2803787 RepID=UPI001922F87F|nr:hypothetical protein [Caldalkalibacillus salinus]